MNHLEESTKTARSGFTLLELLFAIAISVAILSSAAVLFKKGMDLTLMVGERAEMQQNVRAGMNSMIHDLSLAATDLPAGGIQLPQSAAPLAPQFGCAFGIPCYLTNGNNVFNGQRLYYVNPHTQDGAATGSIIPDSLVIAYADPKMILGTVTFPAGDLTGTQIIAANPPTIGNPPTQVNLSAQSNGITVGDLIWLSSTNNNSSNNAIGVVTAFDGKNTITFAAGDPLNINQPPTQNGNAITNDVSGNISSNLLGNPPVNPATITIQAQRIFLVTYYVWQDPVSGRRMLMRQVNAHTATQVAENVENLQVTYDTINNTVDPPVPVVNQNNPAGSPNLIRKINVALTVRTNQKIGSSVKNSGYQGLTLATSVSPRNMSTTAIF